MTKREAIVLSAYTGRVLCDMDDYLKYVGEMFGCTISKQELPMLKEDIQYRATEEARGILNNLTNEAEEVPNAGQMVIN